MDKDAKDGIELTDTTSEPPEYRDPSKFPPACAWKGHSAMAATGDIRELQWSMLRWEKDGTLVGEGKDGNGDFEIKGHYHLETGKVRVWPACCVSLRPSAQSHVSACLQMALARKHLKCDRVAHLRGILETHRGLGMHGTWHAIANGNQGDGTFRIWPVHTTWQAPTRPEHTVLNTTVLLLIPVLCTGCIFLCSSVAWAMRRAVASTASRRWWIRPTCPADTWW